MSVRRVIARNGITVSFEVFGSGPPLLLVHGVFTDHVSNWITVRDGLAERFTVHAIDRRGRGHTSDTPPTSTRDEFDDVAAVIRSVDEPVFLLGHSYGAHVALGAAALVPAHARALILYEPPSADELSVDTERALESDAHRGDWAGFVSRFFSEVTHVSSDELEAVRSSPIWDILVAGARPTISDIRALRQYDFDPGEFRSLSVPVTFLCGSESPEAQFVVTEALMQTLPRSTRVDLEGQGHDAMFRDPRGFVDAVASIFEA